MGHVDESSCLIVTGCDGRTIDAERQRQRGQHIMVLAVRGKSAKIKRLATIIIAIALRKDLKTTQVELTTEKRRLYNVTKGQVRTHQMFLMPLLTKLLFGVTIAGQREAKRSIWFATLKLFRLVFHFRIFSALFSLFPVEMPEWNLKMSSTPPMLF